MRKLLGLFVVFSLLFALPREAPAQYMSTRDFASFCLGQKKEEMSACINYVAGVVDYHMILQSFGTAPTIDFCLPEDMTKEQAAVAVMVYLRTMTQNDAFTAAATIPLALNRKFPCKPARGTKTSRR